MGNLSAYTNYSVLGNNYGNNTDVYNHNIPYVNVSSGKSSNLSSMPIGTIVGAGIGAIGNIWSSYNNAKAQNYAAKLNYNAQIETNNANARLAAKQNEWNMLQWMRNNEYNTPSAQAARYLQAGINPALAMQSGQLGSGNSSSPAQGAPPAHMEAPHYDAPQFDGRVIGDSLGQFFQNILTSKEMQVKETQRESADLDNKLKSLTLMYEADRIKSTARSARTKALVDNLTYQYTRDTQQSRVNHAIYDSKVRHHEVNEAYHRVNLRAHEAALAQARAFNEPQRFNAEMAEVGARVSELLSRKVLNYASAKREIKQAVKLVRETNMLPKWDDSQLERYSDAYLKNMERMGNSSPDISLHEIFSPEVWDTLSSEQKALAIAQAAGQSGVPQILETIIKAASGKGRGRKK